MTSTPPRKQPDPLLPVVKTDDTSRPEMDKTPGAVVERKRMAIHLARKGMNKSQVARAMGISRDVIKYWVKVDPNFKEQWDQASENRDGEIADEMEVLSLGLARGETSKDNIPQWPVIKHWLQVTDPKRHGDKKQVEHTGTVVHTLIPTARRLDDLLADPDIIDIPAIESGEEEDE